MGLDSNAVELTLKLYRDGQFKGFESVIELGSQDLHFEHMDRRMDIYDMLKGSLNLEAETLREIVQSEVNRSTAREFTTEWVYKLLGFKEYRCIDGDGRYNGFIWDLNHPIPENQKLKYNLVTNHGTTEHVFNVYQSFKNIHDLTSPNGIMIHALPFQGYVNHGFYNFQPCFYEDLALENNYEILEKNVVVQSNTNSFESTIKPYIAEEFAETFRSGYSAMLLVVMKKKGKQDFRMPFHGIYGGENCLFPSYKASMSNKILQKMMTILLGNEKSLPRKMIRFFQKLIRY